MVWGCLLEKENKKQKKKKSRLIQKWNLFLFFGLQKQKIKKMKLM